MKRFKKILFLSDPKVTQNTAIRRAVSLAKQNDARVTVLSVLKSSAYTLHVPLPDVELDGLQAQLVDEHQVEVERVADGLRQEGVDAQAKVVVGAVFIVVIREVLRERYDLVILAADSKSRFISRLLGSTSMHLMRKCPCPVWVVKPGSGRPYRRILAAVDTTNDFWDDNNQSINPLILQLAASLAQMDGSDLHLVQVWSVMHEGYLQARGGLSDASVRKLRKNTKRGYLQRLDHLKSGIDLDGIGAVHVHLKQSSEPAAAIIKVACKEKIDLLVMGTVCRTGLAGFFIGNTAEEVLSAVDCSVLTVKPEGFVSPVTLDDG